EQIGEITEADEPGLCLVQRREVDRVEGRVDNQPGHDDDQRKTHQEGNGASPAQESPHAGMRPDRRLGELPPVAPTDIDDDVSAPGGGPLLPASWPAITLLNSSPRCKDARTKRVCRSGRCPQVRSKPSSSFCAHLTTLSIGSLP